MTEPNHTPHPLFPLGLDEEAEGYPDVSWLYVGRHEAGRVVFCPRAFTRDELDSEEAVFKLFGGGRYTLQSKDAGRARWTRRREEALELPGPSRPLLPPGLGGEPPSAPSAPAAAAAAPSGSDPMSLLVQLMAAQAQASQQQNLAMLSTLGNVLAAAVGGGRGGDGSGAALAALTQAQGAQNAAMLALVGKLVERPAGGGAGGNADGLAQGLELGLALGSKSSPIEEVASQMLAGAALAQQHQQQAAAQQQAPGLAPGTS